MTGAEIMGAVGFFVLVFGFIFGLWKYVDAKIGAAKTEASAAASAAVAASRVASTASACRSSSSSTCAS